MNKKIGLYAVDNTPQFPNLPLMKISAWHKQQGDEVDWWLPLMHYDKVYVSKIFGDEYTQMDLTCIDADEVEYGGTGFAIKIENGQEVFHKELDHSLPDEIEHIYPDYSLYPELTKDTAYGFLSRGCPNNCNFCIVSKKEGRCSYKVADLNEFWNGQKNIILLDPNLLACKERLDLLKQLADSGACVDFSQGFDARFITEEVAKALAKVKTFNEHFAFDYMKNEERIIQGLKLYSEIVGKKGVQVYVLTNYDTTHAQDMYRIQKIKECGMMPYIMIYRKGTAPAITRYLQRWCNNRFIYGSCEFEDYAPHSDGKTIKELFYDNGEYDPVYKK